jgi:acyl carrier protein
VPLDIAHKIRSFVVDTFLLGQVEQLRDEDSFLSEGIIDSTGILELVSYIEQTYAIHVEDDELIPENLDSIANVVAFVLSKLNTTTTTSRGAEVTPCAGVVILPRCTRGNDPEDKA